MASGLWKTTQAYRYLTLLTETDVTAILIARRGWLDGGRVSNRIEVFALLGWTLLSDREGE
jgi:hypothetical protein